MFNIASYQEGYTDGAESNNKRVHQLLSQLKAAREMRDKYRDALKRNAPESYNRIRLRNKDNWES